MYRDNLERLLETMFEGDDELTFDFLVLKKRPRPPRIFTACCTYSYTGYDG
jgi:hypothetical protein